MTMKGYKTSKDYKRLKELLDNRHEVKVVDKEGRVFTALKYLDCEYLFSGDELARKIHRCRFFDACKFYGFEVVEPTEI